ncbi:Gfo/Idh/MocA family protein [Paenibacillus elgii]|uniref:Gfo/Idh/MocA family protein n=1 Tax=Paenibacillus elgii TaxID=189691 RepID=UPI000FD66B76|nr:Gfo/Idh/MocA family oxidoreductase [Paenibacillus elgii]NEN83098.1 Gfo/Idh/MocA family oxidoreductase [Paenibacillus elgii]
MSDRIKWGVLGTGRIIGKAGMALNKATNGMWYGVAGRTEENGRSAAGRFGVPRHYESYEALLRDPEIDAVYIALLNHLHKAWAVKACEAGKHVLLEKPFALNGSEAKAIADAAQKHNVLVREAFVWKYYPGFEQMRDWIGEGAIGQWARFYGRFSFVAYESSSRWRKDWGGGALYDIGCYPVAWARYFTQEEPIASDAALDLHPLHGVDRRFAGTLYFAEGRTAQLDAALDLPHGASFELWGTKGKLQVELDVTAEELRIRCRLDNRWEEWGTDRLTPFRLQAESFADAVLLRKQGHSEDNDGAEEALRQARVMDALLEAARTERRVRILVSAE